MQFWEFSSRCWTIGWGLLEASNKKPQIILIVAADEAEANPVVIRQNRSKLPSDTTAERKANSIQTDNVFLWSQRSLVTILSDELCCACFIRASQQTLE